MNCERCMGISAEKCALYQVYTRQGIDKEKFSCPCESLPEQG